MPNARLAQAADLASLLELYRVAEVSASVEPIARAEQIWLEMLCHDGVAVFVSAVDAQIVATCMLITAPNLLRAGRGHGFLENVVTHPKFQGQGHGRAVVHAALAAACARDCYHVLLLCGLEASPRAGLEEVVAVCNRRGARRTRRRQHPDLGHPRACAQRRRRVSGSLQPLCAVSPRNRSGESRRRRG